MSSCASPQVWSVSSISAGDDLYDSTRLRYHSKESYPHLIFEMVRLGGVTESYLSLTRFRLPAHKEVKILFDAEGEQFEERAQVHAGGMRFRLSPETTQKMIGALQAQRKVVILMDDFEETLDPTQFSTFYSEFVGEGNFFEHILKGFVR